MRADDPRLLGIPRSRRTIAIVDPHHVVLSKDFPALPGKVAARLSRDAPHNKTPCTQQCSARAAPDIKGHHRPVIALNFHRIAPIVAVGGGHPRPEDRGQVVSQNTTHPTSTHSRSRSLTELTRQITPPTKNGHAPPPKESRKIFHLSILALSGPGKFPRVESN
jgi:hypothetical protein